MTAFPIIPGYDLLHLLGGGPMTQVFAARDRLTGGACAVKLLRPDAEDSATGLLLLRREARAGLNVRHPSVLSCRVAHVLREPYFLVLPLLMPGESLRRRMARAPRIEIPALVAIARQIAGGLACLHRKGLLHGDLKPDNVMLLPGNGVRIIDLGSAHRPGENQKLIEKGYILGTPDYLAPELCAFRQETRCSADLFSLGIMLYEMIVGRLPYPKGDTGQTLRNHRDCLPDAIPLEAHPLPAAMIDLMYRLLDNRPENRPSAAALEMQLRILEGFGSHHWAAA